MGSDPAVGVGLLVSPVRRAIVDLLANRPREEGVPTGLTAAQLAEALELHVTTVRFHTDQLVAAGLLSAEFSRDFGVGRPRKLYAVAEGTLDPQPTAERDAEALRILSGLLAESFGQPGTTPIEAGQRWAETNIPATAEAPATSPGQWLTKVGRMIDALTDWGYTPDLTTSEGGRNARIDLVRCPFLELARSNPSVVCGIHRGLIGGAMNQFGEEDAEISLLPFVGPELCQAHVRTHTAFDSPERKPA
ncbi:MAG: helix-turn-helix domain-containing protein [Nocardioides sp.]